MERLAHRRWGGSCRDMGAAGWVLAVSLSAYAQVKAGLGEMKC
jgi:hypothetical protein